jgi:hypothetical protein
MKRSLTTLVLPLHCLLLLCFTACKKEATQRFLQLPIVWIGRDTIVDATTATLTLDGSASYARGGSIVEYSWTQFSGPNNINFSNAACAATVVTKLIPGIYQFGLTVTDNKGAQMSAQKKVMVGREFIFEDLSWKLVDVDELDTDAVILASPVVRDLFGPTGQYPVVLNPSPSNLYVKFDTTINWLYVPSFGPNSANSDFIYIIHDSQLFITSYRYKKPEVLNGRRASIKVEFY